MIRGIDVILYRKQQTGEDAFGAPVFNEVAETVHNVLIGEPTTEELVNELQLYGKRLAYTLALPKGDAHDWHDVTVEFQGFISRANCGRNFDEISFSAIKFR